MFYPLLAATLALVIPISPQSVPSSPTSETASANLFASDARLAKTVTLSTTLISLNEACKQITEQTGVPIKMRDRKILGEQKIAVYAENTEARQLLESIAALFRYKNSSSEWRKDASGSGYALSIGARNYAKPAQQSEEQEAPSFVFRRAGADNTLAIDPDEPVQVEVLVARDESTPELSNPTQKTKSAAEDWFTRYDSQTSSLDTKPIYPENPAQKSITLARLLTDISHTQKVPILMLLPSSMHDSSAEEISAIPIANTTASNPGTITSLLAGFTAPPHALRYKWHKGALLLRDPVATLQETPK